VPKRLLGGTYVETPGVLGPWQTADGALYFPMEPAETFNVLMTVKSGDFGESWMEIGGANRPLTDDLEGFATAMHGGREYMLHQISDATYLHAFATTDAASGADTWVIRDELVAEHSEPPTQVAALVADANGGLTAFYGDSLGLRFRMRSPAGEWGAEGRIDGPEGTVASGVMAARGADGRIHVGVHGRERRTPGCLVSHDLRVGETRQSTPGRYGGGRDGRRHRGRSAAGAPGRVRSHRHTLPPRRRLPLHPVGSGRRDAHARGPGRG
jgi:hypothetical protein